MKNYEKSTCRFVKEYANYKISVCEDLKKSFPTHRTIDITIYRIEVIRDAFNEHIITVDEAMKKIADADSWARMMIISGDAEELLERMRKVV